MASKILISLFSPKMVAARVKCASQFILSSKCYSSNVPVKEIKIPTDWGGHVAAKLWGHENQRPILALHGWQDNAGTWDPLAPMLTGGCSILAIDFPGHGLSSWYPRGMQYYPWDFPRLILHIKEHFKWDKISLLCHSMGSIAGLRFACLFPNDVDMYIALDSLIYDDYDLHFVVEKYQINLQKIIIEESRMNQEPPSYSLEEMRKKWHIGTNKSVALESVQHLLKRGSKPSKFDPNKYIFSRDSKLKYLLFNPEDKKFIEALLLKLKCPTLYIKAIDSPYASDTFSVEMRDIIAKNNDKYELQFVPGTHHVHLNNPEKVAPLIISYLQRYNLYNEV